ncbi:MAG: ABC transporter permease [Phycisphaerae bacterium]|nr:ABC transporter permease [Phycisphaerae bacterium]
MDPAAPFMARVAMKARHFRAALGWGGAFGGGVLLALLCACLLAAPWVWSDGAYDRQDRAARHLPPVWWPHDDEQLDRLRSAARERAAAAESTLRGIPAEALTREAWTPSEQQVGQAMPSYLLGTDLFGRDVLVRCLAGGSVSLAVGLLAAGISVVVGTLWGALAAWRGGRTDALLMRTVDVLYGLPYVLLVVLVGVAADGVLDRIQESRSREARRQRESFVAASIELAPGDARTRASAESQALELYGTGALPGAFAQSVGMLTLAVAIGGVSWLTLARVVRGQVLSLKNRPFVEAARAVGVGPVRLFMRHLLPNLAGPVIVYATLTIPQAMLQESFLSFLGIGVRPPLPSWGNMVADGLGELNPVRSNWWLLVFPCLLLAATLLSLNLLGESLRAASDPRARTR